MPGVDLNNRYLFKGKIVLESALHVGGGDLEYSATDSAVVKLADQRPYIPGSSLKGVFRSTVERIVANLDPNSSCLLFAGDKLSDCPSVNNQVEQEIKQKQIDKVSEQKLVTFLEQHLCDTCKLFGSRWMASKVSFNDAIVMEPWSEVIEQRDGVGIDRDSEKAVEKCKFNYEAVPAATSFNFELTGENLTAKELGMVAVGLMEMVEGAVRLGGLTSRGLGFCRLELERIEYLDYHNLDTVKEYLINRKMQVADDCKDFLQQAIIGLVTAVEKGDKSSC